MTKAHSFHIPVMGIGFTIDTPLKVSQFGMDSVISLVDDILIEKLREMYCHKFKIPYTEITEKIEDFRAKRITSYLDLIKILSEQKFEALKNFTFETFGEIKRYFHMLPDASKLKQEFLNMTKARFDLEEIKAWVLPRLEMGSIDVNIMTKVDKENYRDKEKLPSIYNDAHAALRGFANSCLCSSVILSAGMNPRLYSYLEEFDDFYPDSQGNFKKKVVLKVSDFRSALIQGKFLAKKGIWVSEYRIESGLNCGGHAFATDGFLIGPILKEFRDNRNGLTQTVQEILVAALTNKNRAIPDAVLPVKITAQGGVGTSEEHQFILDHYKVDSVGWGTPFLLVPEASTVDTKTRNQLVLAKEEDLYLSDTSPLGVPFHSLRGNTKDEEKYDLIKKGRPGSSCPKKFVSLNKDFTDKGICTASRQYQDLKIKELDSQRLPKAEYQTKYNKIVEKSCTCVGLGTSAMLAYGLDTKKLGNGVSICPGPNMAYFSKIMTLTEITDHIYGRGNVISRIDRPNMFIKELNIYLDYLKAKVKDSMITMDQKQKQYLLTFANNLNHGISYYKDLFNNLVESFETSRNNILLELENAKHFLARLQSQIESLHSNAVVLTK